MLRRIDSVKLLTRVDLLKVGRFFLDGELGVDHAHFNCNVGREDVVMNVESFDSRSEDVGDELGSKLAESEVHALRALLGKTHALSKEYRYRGDV